MEKTEAELDGRDSRTYAANPAQEARCVRMRDHAWRSVRAVINRLARMMNQAWSHTLVRVYFREHTPLS